MVLYHNRIERHVTRFMIVSTRVMPPSPHFNGSIQVIMFYKSPLHIFSSIHHYHTTSLYPWLSPVYKHIHNYHSCFFTAMLPRSRTLPSRIYNGVVRSCPYLSIFLGEIVLFSSDILALHRCFRWKSGKTSGTTCRWKSSLNPMARVKQ